LNENGEITNFNEILVGLALAESVPFISVNATCGCERLRKYKHEDPMKFYLIDYLGEGNQLPYICEMGTKVLTKVPTPSIKDSSPASPSQLSWYC